MYVHEVSVYESSIISQGSAGESSSSPTIPFRKERLKSSNTRSVVSSLNIHTHTNTQISIIQRHNKETQSTQAVVTGRYHQTGRVILRSGTKVLCDGNTHTYTPVHIFVSE